MRTDVDYYEILEVHPKASLDVIKKAYQTLAKKYHPDTTSLDPTIAHAKMALLNEAFSVLSDTKNRNQYDSFIAFSKLNHNQTMNRNEDSNKTGYLRKYASNITFFVILGLTIAFSKVIAKEITQHVIEPMLVRSTSTNYDINSIKSINKVSPDLTKEKSNTVSSPVDSETNHQEKIHSENELSELINIFRSEEFGFSLKVPREWKFVAPAPKDQSIVLDAINPLNGDEVKVTVIDFKNSSTPESFQGISELQRRKFITDIMKVSNKYLQQHGISAKYINDGKCKVNGEYALWLTMHQISDVNQQQTFLYFMIKNKKLYMISYFSSSETLQQPQSQEIIDSINSFKFI